MLIWSLFVVNQVVRIHIFGGLLALEKGVICGSTMLLHPDLASRLVLAFWIRFLTNFSSLCLVTLSGNNEKSHFTIVKRSNVYQKCIISYKKLGQNRSQQKFYGFIVLETQLKRLHKPSVQMSLVVSRAAGFYKMKTEKWLAVALTFVLLSFSCDIFYQNFLTDWIGLEN
jgi:hypothetical protein